MHPGLPPDDAELLCYAGIDPRLAPRDGLFRPDGWLRRISGEPSVLFGGARALLLEVAHPLVAAGVAEHSDVERDPFGRLQRTLAAVTALAFASRDEALAAARGVARSHEAVSGTLDVAIGPFADGTAYHGRDPELVLWVWATLVDTALAVYRDFVGPSALRRITSSTAPSIALSGENISTERTCAAGWPKRSTRPSRCW
jgi:uncharacterized protein (DUF2236 family)